MAQILAQKDLGKVSLKKEVMVNQTGFDEVIAVDLEHSDEACFSFEGIAAQAVLAIFDGKPLELLQKEVLAEFDVSPDQLSRDLARLIAFLQKSKLTAKDS